MKIQNLFKIIVFLIVITSCSSPVDKDTTTSEKKESLSVSFIGNTTFNKNVMAKLTVDDLHPFDPSIYAEPFNSDAKGTRVGNFTPTNFICSITHIGVSSENVGNYPLIPEFDAYYGEHSSYGIIGSSFDLAFSKDIIELPFDSTDMFSKMRPVNNIIFQFFAEEKSDNLGFKSTSEVYVDLGEKYKDVNFPKELRDKKRGSIHCFHLNDLIPLKSTSVIAMIFAPEITSPMILNPDGQYAKFNPFFNGQHPDEQWGMEGSVLCLPMTQFDPLENNEIIFNWKLEDLIEVYDNKTPNDYSDDLITLRLDNPFPVTLYTTDSTNSPIDDTADGLPPPPVANFTGKTFEDFYDGNVVFLNWLNPSVKDFNKVRIIKKEGTAPSDQNDGTIVYEGKFPICKDLDVEKGKTYFYSIYVEDTEAQVSRGETIKITIY